MKRIILFALCSLLAGATVAQAAPLVELLFDDAPLTATANLGSLGGTQNLPPTSGAKSTDVPPTSFDSVTSWVQGGYAATGYGTYNLTGMSAMRPRFGSNPTSTSHLKISGTAIWARAVLRLEHMCKIPL